MKTDARQSMHGFNMNQPVDIIDVVDPVRATVVGFTPQRVRVAIPMPNGSTHKRTLSPDRIVAVAP